MESANLTYNSILRVIICIEHGYCLQPQSVHYHLKRVHKLKGIRLKTACEEVKKLEPIDPLHLLPPPDQIPIKNLPVQPGFECGVVACNSEKRFVSRNYETVRKHLSAVHSIGHRPGKTKPQPSDIRVTCVQSYLRNPHDHPFVVQSPGAVGQHAVDQHAVLQQTPPATSPSPLQTFLQEQYSCSQQQWKDQYKRLPAPDTETVDETAPWLRRTGISRWIASLNIDTAELQESMQPSASTSTDRMQLIKQAVSSRLGILRQRAFPGSSESSINRVTARILNSFEEGRIQSKVFHGVQEYSTMKKYTAIWSGAIIFLLYLFEDPNHPLRAIYIQEASDVCRHLRALSFALTSLNSQLHADNTPTFDQEDLFLQEDIPEDESTVPRELASIYYLARYVSEEIESLSFLLIRTRQEQSAFTSPLVGYMALLTLTSEKAWIGAHDFSYLLSRMIHCMQLWILGYCIRSRDDGLEGTKSLEEVVRTECMQYLINTTSTPLAEFLFWRPFTWKAGEDSVRLPVTTLNIDRMQVTHLNIELSIDSWRRSLQVLFQSAEKIYQDHLTFGIPDIPIYSVANLVDSPSDSRPSKCFLDDPRNQLDAVKDWLFTRLHADETLTMQFFQPSGPTAEAGSHDGSPAPYCIRTSAANTYLHTNQRFLKELGVLIYWLAGLPPRRKELTRIQWCNSETARNVYILDGLVVLLTGYHKSQWRIGTRPVARFLPAKLGDLLVRYLIYVVPFVRFLEHCMQYPSQRGYLFRDETGVWEPDRFGRCVKGLSTRLLGFPITSRQWRHISIALDRRLNSGHGCKALGVSQDWDQHALHAGEGSDSEDDPDYCVGGPDESAFGLSLPQARSFQASHSLTVHQNTYGNDLNLHHGLTDAGLAAFRSVSYEWFGSIACFEGSSSIACSRKRHLSELSRDSSDLPAKYRPNPGSVLEIRRRMWTWSAIEKVLQQLFGPHAKPRDIHQRNGLLLVARCRPELIIVLPTGSGKSLLFTIPSQLPGAQVTVVIVPLIALRLDLQQRLKDWGLVYTTWQPGITSQQLHALPTLLLVGIEDAVTDGFVGFIRALHAIGRLDRLVLDEAHLLLTAVHYRTNLSAIIRLRQVKIPFICMTATLPPFTELDLRTSLGLNYCEQLRASSDRPNLQYRVQFNSQGRSDQRSRDDFLISLAETTCKTHFQTYIQSQKGREIEPARGNAYRAICFVRRKGFGQKLADRMQSHFYHGDLTSRAREVCVTAWSRGTAGDQGRRSPCIVATSALSAGVHYPAVRLLLHVDTPDGLVNYGQETGRAGRDGLPALCLVLLAPNWEIAWDNRYHNDFLGEDRKKMHEYLRTQQCRREFLTVYLDGEPGTACRNPDSAFSPRELCDSCAASPPARLQSISGATDASSRPPANTAVSPGTEFSDDRTPSVRSWNSEALLGQELDALGTTSDPEFPTDDDDSMRVDTMQSIPEKHIYDIAAFVACMKAKEKVELVEQYESYIARWGRACIPCSFVRKALVEGKYHHPCVQTTEYRSSLDRHRYRIRFTAGIGCFRCGQPLLACKRGIAKTPCQYPWLAWHASWVAWNLDTAYGSRLVETLGGPQLDGALNDTMQSRYTQWLGQPATLGEIKLSNMALVSFYWMDHMQALCMQTPST